MNKIQFSVFRKLISKIFEITIYRRNESFLLRSRIYRYSRSISSVLLDISTVSVFLNVSKDHAWLGNLWRLLKRLFRVCEKGDWHYWKVYMNLKNKQNWKQCFVAEHVHIGNNSSINWAFRMFNEFLRPFWTDQYDKMDCPSILAYTLVMRGQGYLKTVFRTKNENCSRNEAASTSSKYFPHKRFLILRIFSASHLNPFEA